MRRELSLSSIDTVLRIHSVHLMARLVANREAGKDGGRERVKVREVGIACLQMLKPFIWREFN